MKNALHGNEVKAGMREWKATFKSHWTKTPLMIWQKTQAQ